MQVFRFQLIIILFIQLNVFGQTLRQTSNLLPSGIIDNSINTRNNPSVPASNLSNYNTGKSIEKTYFDIILNDLN